MRFSVVVHERGSPETMRDVRGFSVKMYTREGNWWVLSVCTERRCARLRGCGAHREAFSTSGKRGQNEPGEIPILDPKILNLHHVATLHCDNEAFSARGS